MMTYKFSIRYKNPYPHYYECTSEITHFNEIVLRVTNSINTYYTFSSDFSVLTICVRILDKCQVIIEYEDWYLFKLLTWSSAERCYKPVENYNDEILEVINYSRIIIFCMIYNGI